MKRFLLSNKIYLPIGLLLIVLMIYGAYFARANMLSQIDRGRVLGASEEYVGQNYLPIARDKDLYSKEFFQLKNFPQKMHQGEMPDLESASVYIYSPSSDYAFAEKNSKNQHSIASITKLMTALVFLENNPGWENIYEIKKEDRVDGGRIYLYLGERVRLIDLFNLSLVASANTATKALVNSTGLSIDEFVQKMNKKANDLGMNSTKYVDPIGINSQNVSTAQDLSLLLQVVIENKNIREVVEKSEYQFKTVSGKPKRVYSTDGLLEKYPKNNIELLGGKTGFIDAAGFCFAGVFRNKEGKEVISIVLGAKDPFKRFSETDNLVSWVYSTFLW